MECLSNNDVSNILGNKSLCNKILKSWNNILRGKNKIILEEGNIKKGNIFAFVILSCFKSIYILNVRQLIEI